MSGAYGSAILDAGRLTMDGRRRPGEPKLAGQVGSVSRYMAQLRAGIAEGQVSRQCG